MPLTWISWCDSYIRSSNSASSAELATLNRGRCTATPSLKMPTTFCHIGFHISRRIGPIYCVGRHRDAHRSTMQRRRIADDIASLRQYINRQNLRLYVILSIVRHRRIVRRGIDPRPPAPVFTTYTSTAPKSQSKSRPHQLSSSALHPTFWLSSPRQRLSY